MHYRHNKSLGIWGEGGGGGRYHSSKFETYGFFS